MSTLLTVWTKRKVDTMTACLAEHGHLISHSSKYRSKDRLGGALLVALDPVPDTIYGLVGDGVKQICWAHL
ncbi:Endoglucanase 15 [Clarias magur]|uniref:Endoglucanase 15 n=1 Tax=Clarias magur TaxID=1594786 RepID=A0A8J4XFG2_CLAMG|nr:Endoglucanase 15 [Clarias magur]